MNDTREVAALQERVRVDRGMSGEQALMLTVAEMSGNLVIVRG